jgi:hypothetical protein
MLSTITCGQTSIVIGMFYAICALIKCHYFNVALFNALRWCGKLPSIASWPLKMISANLFQITIFELGSAIYVRMQHFVRRTTFVPCRRFWGMCGESSCNVFLMIFMVLCVPISTKLCMRAVLSAVACLPVPRA